MVELGLDGVALAGHVRFGEEGEGCVSHCGSRTEETPLRGRWFMGGIIRGLTPTSKSTSSLRD